MPTTNKLPGDDDATGPAAALERIGRYLPPTPVRRLDALSERLGADIWVKLETHQPTGSFKVRGALNALLRATSQGHPRVAVTASQGNHGMALAHAAKLVGTRAVVFVSRSVPRDRVEALQRIGADVRPVGTSWDEANAEAQSYAESVAALYVHPFNNADVMAGQGTIVLELLAQLPSISSMIASIGGGGLLSGLISAARVHAPDIKLYGVETVGADRLFLSRQAGKVVRIPRLASIALSLGALQTEQFHFDLITKFAADLVRVSDEQALESLRTLYAEEKLVAEPAGTCCLAALEHAHIPVVRGERVVVVLCGANVSAADYAAWLVPPAV